MPLFCLPKTQFSGSITSNTSGATALSMDYFATRAAMRGDADEFVPLVSNSVSVVSLVGVRLCLLGYLDQTCSHTVCRLSTF
jgi:hypothetical protein